jgi:4-aminobutyrate aminotransferase
MYYAPYPYYFRSPFGSAPAEADDYYLSELKTLFDTMDMPDDVAAILVETVAGEGGYLVPSARWLQEIRSICDEHGIMLILDEIQTGMGRTGAMWGFEHFDVVPDIMTVAKGIASGLPVSAVVANRSTMDKWPPGSHGGTYGANAVGTAAAAETLRVMRDEHLPENAAEIGDMLTQGLRDIQANHPVIGEVRGLGLMLAVEFVDQQGEPNPAAVAKVIAACLEEQVLLINCGTYDQAIRVIPPLVINRQQAREFLDIFERAVAAI